MPAPTSRRALVRTAVVALVVVTAVLTAPLVGSWQFDPRFTPPETDEVTETSAELPTAEPSAEPPAPEAPPEEWELPDLTWLLVVVAVLAGLVLLALLVRLVLWLRRPTPPPPPDPSVLAGAGDAEDEPQIPVLHRGVRAAVAHLEQIREPRDAIVAAWLALEEAAARSGVRRRPAQTPTEFTAAVLTRTGADQQAVTALLRLYHRARFATAEPGPADVGAATEAFAALTASWPELAERPDRVAGPDNPDSPDSPDTEGPPR
ncbi:DUF4129 domain-containing protein [Ruania halotolerans]|uniref:DUF4129 domain-containing protein n=1 Tax=Ruania halotolerans TaxID=2897773 RepID=UPI001E448BCA|nr:DUF4129 domain-containing protein [Ruania halotolerans]UFU05548.1 DUF4129 domain-containing protein [Ruania halotolerans]